MLLRVTQVLKNNEIPYWLEGGTLLGVIRENRLLPWDNDMDISIRFEDVDRLMSILWKVNLKYYLYRFKTFKQDDFPFHKGDVRIVKIFNRKWIFDKGDLSLDIFIKKRVDDQRFWYVGVKRYTKKSVPARFYDDLTEIKFGKKNVSVPRDYEGYLTYRYGDWRTPVKEWDFSRDDRAILDSSKKKA